MQYSNIPWLLLTEIRRRNVKKPDRKSPRLNLRAIFRKKEEETLSNLPDKQMKELPDRPTKIKRKRMSTRKRSCWRSFLCLS